MAIPSLPIGAEAIQRQAQDARTQVGNMGWGQDKEPAVVDHQAQASISLRSGPSDPLVAVLEMFGCCAEEQQRQPIAMGIHGGVIQLLTHSSQAAKVMMSAEQFLKTTALLRPGDLHEMDLL
jgi:hypothetical protein